ncbi:MAG: DUF488 family protein [Sedimentibacter sp.]
MAKLYTIGFTKKSAQKFFELLEMNNVNTIIDIRLNNTSQLSGFAKYPDIKFFLKRVCNIDYLHDLQFSPTEDILKNYKKKVYTWQDYVEHFENLMIERKIDKHIINNYSDCLEKNYCLLCSEDTPENCHRSLVSDKFNKIFSIELKHLL